MSVKRYTNGADDDQGIILPFMEESPNGDYVEYSDYARLKAEVERLKGIILAQSSDFVRSKTADDGIKPDGHNDLAGRAVEHCLKLQIENERLRKAIHNFLSVNPNTSNPCGCGFWTCETKDLLELNNALEGKPSV